MVKTAHTPKERCTERVPSASGWGFGTCSNNAKIQDPSGWHCGIHSDAKVAERKAKQQAEYDAETRRWEVQAKNQRKLAAFGDLLAAAQAAMIVMPMGQPEYRILQAAIAKATDAG